MLIKEGFGAKPHPLWISPSKIHHTKMCTCFLTQSFPRTNCKGGFVLMWILQADSKKNDIFLHLKSLCLQKKALNQKHPLWISSSKKHNSKMCGFLIFQHSHFLKTIPRRFGVHVHCIDRIEKAYIFLNRKNSMLTKESFGPKPFPLDQFEKNHAKRCRFLIFVTQSFPRTNSKGVFWSKCAFYRQNGKTDVFFIPKKLRMFWTKPPPCRLARV